MNERELLREQLFQDHFESHWCLACGGRAALYAIPPGEFLGACSNCLVSRIERLRESGGDLPPWVHALEQEARREIAYEAKNESGEFALRFDDFYRCTRCGKLIHQSDTRYPAKAKDGFAAIAPHCLECLSVISEG